MTENAPELSPKEQREQDLARVQAQLGVTDMTRTVTSVMGSIFGGDSNGPGPFARSDFEGRQLNDLIDLVENTNPADLENAGNALWSARDALRDAAGELLSYVNKVEWKGESGEEFKSFGRALAGHAGELAKFADVAGTQITVAGTGLASVKMPPRDTRAVKRKPESIPPEERAANKAEYDKAVQVEKDRQEAINQMYKLASYYAVSEQTLAAQEPPEFKRTLKANVPPPSATYSQPQREAAANAGLADGASRDDLSDAGSRSSEGSTRTEPVGTVAPARQTNTSMEIDSVLTQTPPTTPAPQAPVSPPTGPNPSPTSPMPPVAPFLNQTKGGPRPLQSTGLPRTTGPAKGPVGRVGGSETTPAVGRPGPSNGKGGQPPMGRTGGPGPLNATNQNPGVGRAGGPPNAPVGRGANQQPTRASRTGRTDGIIGGRPQRPTGPSSASRIPGGKVIGVDATPTGRTGGGRIGQHGVVGSPPANTGARTGARPVAGPNGVVGTPRAGATGSRPGAGGFTQGGSGLARGARNREKAENEEQERTESSRPDYLTEDEETWEARRRNAVPPVID
ncbi:hypothetical protein J7E88_33590 [Streptomyces sp. ISL-10]|uniref:hypothetical protein n=1 Tax=Streptomyces sp. ISL-10 TaxID=2819172 RepID=UPI001BE610B3|nr:hypothetical protein [Streptomyces sp. ISL-10]MBT2370073.1 hypothetical protein [Streptomyces sp. ISL-10]